MKIIFKNGKELEVFPEIAEIIIKNLGSPKGMGQFQTFSDQNGKPYLILNMLEVLYIQ